MKHINIIIAFIAVLGLSACGSSSTTVKKHALTTDVSGLVRDHSADPTILLKRPDAPTLASYNSFIIDPVRVSYRDPKMNKISSKDLSRMQRYFRDQVSSELKEAGYGITNQPGPNTMRITFTLSGIKAPNALPNAVGLLAPVALSVGEVTVEAAFSETTTNRIDAVVIDRSQGSRVLNAKPWSTWADIESSFDTWAKGIAHAVKKSHGLKRHGIAE